MRNRVAASAAVVSPSIRLIPARDRRRQNAELASNEVLLTLTHEIRGPLTAICGWVSLMQAGHLPSQQFPRALQIIAHNASRLSSLVDEVQDLTRITTGAVPSPAEPADLRAIVSTVIDSVRPEAERSHVRLSVLHQAGPLLLLVDSRPPRSDRAESRIERLEVHRRRRAGRGHDYLSQGMARLMVADTGVGIPAEHIESIFEPFRQGAASNGVRTGLGLGLAIVRQIVQRYGGQVRAVSPGVGRGSTFVVTLPLAP